MILKKATAKLREVGIADVAVIKRPGMGKEAWYYLENPDWKRQERRYYLSAEEAIEAALAGKRPVRLPDKEVRDRKRSESFSGEMAFNLARQKARFGHCDWLVWKGKDGVSRARRLSTPEAMKECLLAVGTKGHWTLVCASNANLMKGFWRMGINILAQFKYGMR